MEVQGSASRPYVLKNVAGVYSCSCPAWRNQSLPIERRTCKHLRQLRGDAAEEARIGTALPPVPLAGKNGDAPPRLLLAEVWDGSTDPTGWWLSEKLDGVRAYWDGTRFLSRQGNRYHAPDWFTAGLPGVPLDGELWLGRKQFQRAVSIVRRQDQTDLWQEVCFLVFDAPAVDTGFEERLEFLRSCLAHHQPPYARLHAHLVCRGVGHLQQQLAHVEAQGGEGLMLRQPRSRYVAGRSPTLLKVKRFRDAEALVVGHEPGRGRHRGRLGALLVELADGTRFAVGTGLTDADRDRPPPVGTTITFRYQELTDRGVPRFPVFGGIRADAAPLLTLYPGGLAMSRGSGATARRFEFSAGRSHKFWEISTSGAVVTVCFGRIGSQGQVTVKSFADAAAAEEHVARMIRQKLVKGYHEVPSPDTPGSKLCATIRSRSSRKAA
jgi:DNA ligase-1